MKKITSSSKRTDLDRELEVLVKKIGSRIRYFRVQQGLKQAQLAERGNLGAESRISDIERGQWAIGLRTLMRISKALGVDLYQLFQFDVTAQQGISKAVVKKRLGAVDEMLDQSLTQAKHLKNEVRKLLKSVDSEG
ncbi:helix-turn-helix transcriptional regulator [Bdellovibrionota bacterium FG-1]